MELLVKAARSEGYEALVTQFQQGAPRWWADGVTLTEDPVELPLCVSRRREAAPVELTGPRRLLRCSRRGWLTLKAAPARFVRIAELPSSTMRSGATAYSATPIAGPWLEPADGGDNLFGHQLQWTKGTDTDNGAVRDLHA